MTETMLYTPEELLETFGFEQIDDGLWFFSQECGQGGKASDTLAAIVIVEFNKNGTYSGHVPHPTEIPGRCIPYRSFVFTTDVAEDMIALAQNELAIKYEKATGRSTGDGFVDKVDPMQPLITAPFMNSPWKDYGLGLGANRTDRRIRLESPGAVYGKAYADWRDELCLRVMSNRQQLKMG